MTDGAYFLDRNPRYFPYVLDYLRNGQLVLDSDISLKAIKYEASYFGLVNLEEELNKKICLEEGKCQRWIVESLSMLASRNKPYNEVLEAAQLIKPVKVCKEV